MDILLVLNRGMKNDIKMIVKLHEKDLIEEVSYLITQERKCEAFDLVVREAQVHSYIPAGTKSLVKPHLTFIEDLL